ncbi:MAG: hypothetical protein ACFFDW_17120 [Candidatus Thorarchaeota archaeon]
MRILGWRKIALVLILSILINSFSFGMITQKESQDNEVVQENNQIKPQIKNPVTSIGKYEITSEEFGDQRYFWSLNLGTGMYEQIRATLLAVGEKCYIYMANETITTKGQYLAISTCNYYQEEFDDVIYDKNVALMGHPDGILGDIDGDPKITILIAPLGGAGGLYLQKDEIAGSSYSNNREMVYIDSGFGKTVGGLKTLMHEFNHLIWFNYDLNEGHFLLEGAAEYSVCYGNYLSSTTNQPGINLTWHTNSFKTSHQKSLLSFHETNNFPDSADYGKAYLFMLYMIEQLGIDFVKILVEEELDGPLGIDAALNATGFELEFNDLFMNWITAVTIDRIVNGNDMYQIKSANFVVEPDVVIASYPNSKYNCKHYPYGFHVKRLLHPPDNFTFLMSNPQPTYALGVTIAINDQEGWKIEKGKYVQENELVGIHVSGKNISEAYIVTSIISEETPTTFRDFIEVGYETYLTLDYSIEEGHIPLTITEIAGIVPYKMIILLSSSLLLVTWHVKRSKK